MDTPLTSPIVLTLGAEIGVETRKTYELDFLLRRRVMGVTQYPQLALRHPPVVWLVRPPSTVAHCFRSYVVDEGPPHEGRPYRYTWHAICQACTARYRREQKQHWRRADRRPPMPAPPVYCPICGKAWADCVEAAFWEVAEKERCIRGCGSVWGNDPANFDDWVMDQYGKTWASVAMSLPQCLRVHQDIANLAPSETSCDYCAHLAAKDD
jgi:hypothetical protein